MPAPFRGAFVAILFFLTPVSRLVAVEPLSFRSGDTVVLTGTAIIERAQHNDHIETALQLAAGSEVTGLKFRNLGWSGDSVFADARSYFGPPREGRDRLAKTVGELKPAIVFLCHGTEIAIPTQQGWTNDPTGLSRSRAGEAESLALFVEGYGKLLDSLKENAGAGLREVVLIAPPPLENLGAPLPDQTENNRRLAAVRDAIRKLAETRGHRFVDLFGAMGGDSFDGKVTETPLTDNGIHFGEAGYREIARHLIEGVGLAPPENLIATEAKVEEMRRAIVKKNRLFFHRWRPANETYLFLFRKHEQGQNAKEIPMFDPLIAEKEKEIETLRAAVFEELRKR